MTEDKLVKMLSERPLERPEFFKFADYTVALVKSFKCLKA